MNIAVRYYSRSGNTKALAEAIAKPLDIKAVSIDDDNADIYEEVDMLFIGGALYAYGLDKNLKNYIKSLKAENIKKAAVFSTSWLSKHSLTLIKKALEEQGIFVVSDTLYAKNMPNEDKLKEAEAFARKFI